MEFIAIWCYIPVNSSYEGKLNVAGGVSHGFRLTLNRLLIHSRPRSVKPIQMTLLPLFHVHLTGIPMIILYPPIVKLVMLDKGSRLTSTNAFVTIDLKEAQ